MEWLQITPERYSESFHNYSATFDCCGTIKNHAKESLLPRDGFLTNFLGTIVNPSYFKRTFLGKKGSVEPTPIPGNWHE